ncbi:MAG: hypothetical protein ACP5N2_03765 [Candidatus Nanoarchaeia archaeon]
MILLVTSSYAYDCNQFTGLDKENCITLNSLNEDLIANIIYKNTTYPDHVFVRNYNQNIQVKSPPNGTLIYTNNSIKNAWIKILSIEPSVGYENKTYVSKVTTCRAEYNYTITSPVDYYNNNQVNGNTCKILYSKYSEQSTIFWKVDNKVGSIGKVVQVIADNYSLLQAQADITSKIKADQYIWNKYCCQTKNGRCTKYCYQCKFKKTTYATDKLSIKDSINVMSYNHYPSANFMITDLYENTYKGTLTNDNVTSILLSFNQSYLKDQEYVYSANFSNKPYYFLYLIAEKRDLQSQKNLLWTNGSVYVSDSGNCSLERSDFFTTQNQVCQFNITEKNLTMVSERPVVHNLAFFVMIVVFIFVLFLIYKVLKKYWGKWIISIVILLLFIPTVSAEDCSITNLGTCIPQMIYNFFLNMFNAPLAPLLDIVKNLMQSAPSISIFQGVWAIIVYCISLFYGLLIVYAGFLFLFSGHDVIKREMAKEWLKNTVIMIVLIQGSFYLYGLVVEIGALMTSSVLSMVNPHFFMLTVDNLANLGLEFLLVLLYAIILLITMLFLAMRYLTVVLGVLFVPIGLFCYFIPPLKSYGKLILNILGMFIFITFLDAIIILACSMLIDLPTFQNMKIIVMMTCFILIDLLFIILVKHIIHKTSLDTGIDKAVQAAKYIGMML